MKWQCYAKKINSNLKDCGYVNNILLCNSNINQRSRFKLIVLSAFVYFWLFFLHLPLFQFQHVQYGFCLLPFQLRIICRHNLYLTSDPPEASAIDLGFAALSLLLCLGKCIPVAPIPQGMWGSTVIHHGYMAQPLAGVQRRDGVEPHGSVSRLTWLLLSH